MEQNEFPRGQLNPTILSTMTSGDKYGYEIIDEIKQKTGIEIKQPSLYSSLKRMETQKLVSSYWKDSAIGGKRHYYCITNDGRKFLEQNPVDFSIYNISSTPKIEEKTEEFKTETTSTYEEEKEKFMQQENFSGVVLNTAKPVNIAIQEPSTPVQTVEEKIVEQPEEKTTILEQENLFSIVKEKQEEKLAQPALNEPNEELQDNSDLQYNLFNEVDMAADDGKFITETLEDYYIPKFERFEPATLNIEQRDSSYLNAKIKQKQPQERKQTQAYQEKISDMFVKQPEPFDHEKSMAKIQQKIDQFEAEKRRQKEEEERRFAPPKPKQPEPINVRKEEFNKIENTYVREKQPSKIFNSYKSLETYYESKGIGFNEYRVKDKNSINYVNPSLVRVIRASLFFIVSLILSISFYCGINAPAIGKEIYIVIPCFALLIVMFYCFLYFKTRKRNIIQMKKQEMSPIVLPLVSVALILVTIGLNLIFGFTSATTLKFFPVLIYPIILSIHFMILTPLTLLITAIIRKFRALTKYKN